MKTIYKSILSLATLLACTTMSAWGADYEKITGFIADSANPKGNVLYGAEEFNETFDRLVDGKTETKWCCSSFSSGYIEFHHTSPVYIHGYVLTTANDNASNAGRNPKDWTLYGKTNQYDTTWDVIDDVVDDKILQDANFTPFYFELPTPTQKSYQYFRLEINSIQNGYTMQLSELELLCSDTKVECAHIKKTHYPAQPATCTKLATIEYWECMDCRTKFSDEAATTEITNINVSDAYGTHSNLVHHEAEASTCTQQGHSEYWSCEECQKNFSDAEATAEIEDLASIVLAPIEGAPFSIIDDRTTSTSACGYCSYYNYGGSQNLYLASEIGGAIAIKSISLYCNSSNSNHLREIEIWMGETSDEELDPQKPFSDQQLTRVFNGQKTIGISEGWEELVLDTEYAYSGEKNLVIAIYTPTGSYKEIIYWAGSSDNKNAIYRQLDGDSSYADITYTENYTSGSRPIMRINKPGHPDEKSTNINGIITCSLCGAREEPASIMTLALDDIHSYERATSAKVNSLTYTRSFDTADEWRSIYLPFSFEYTEEDAAQYDLAEINTYGVSSDTNEDGVIDAKDQKVLLIQLFEAGKEVKANTPYLIRPKTTDPITFTSDDGLLYKAEAGSVSCSTLKETLTFVGNNTLKQNLKSEGYYIMSKNQLIKAISDEEVLKPFSWYMQSTSAKTATTIVIVERGAHVHTDKNEDGQCDGCDYQFPLEIVTEDSYESLGLDEDYIGYYAISKYWQLCNAMSMMEDNQYSIYNFVLTNDIIANKKIFDDKGNQIPGLHEWYGGTLNHNCVLDGNGHSIKGLYFTHTSNKVGLFEYIESGSSILNLGIEDSYFYYSNNRNDVPLVGSFAAESKGKISNCWSNATIIASTGNKGGNVGGFVGYSENGQFEHCTFNGIIDLKDAATVYVGGITGFEMPSDYGWVNFHFDGCHFDGTIRIKNVAEIEAGGICGKAANLTFNQCWSDGRIETDKNILKGYIGGILGNCVAIIEGECGSDTKIGATIYDCANMTNLAGYEKFVAGGIIGNGGDSDIHIYSSINVGSITNDDAKCYTTECYGEGSPTVEAFRYLSTEFEPNEEGNMIGMTDEVFKSGQLVKNFYDYAEQEFYWGQNIGVDPYPVPDTISHQHVYVIEHNGNRYVNEAMPESVFAVEDGFSFINNDEIEFTVKEATYSRQMTNAWGTLCVPFSINYDPTNTGYNLYTLDEITKAEDGESDVLVFKELEEGKIDGGTPLVVKLLKGSSLEIKSENATFATETTSTCCNLTGWNAVGTLENLNGNNQLDPETVSGDIYYIAQNKFWYANMAFDMKAFRSWFETTQASASIRRFLIGEWTSETSTEIQIIENEEDRTVHMIFNLAGQRQDSLHKGLNIVNNEKTLIK